MSWQVGIIAGLREAGVDLADFDEILGTSAGALVGALLASGHDVTDALTSLATLAKSINPRAMSSGNDKFLRAMQQANLHNDPHQAIRNVGHTAVTSETIPQRSYLDLFSLLGNVAWPPNFRCTAVDAESGELVVWDRDSEVSLRDAVASSCAIPALFPPVTLKGQRYIDGGLISHLNSTSVLPSEVVIVLSCHPLGGLGTNDHRASASSLGFEDAELQQLGATARLTVIEPRFDGLNITAEQMMDAAAADQAIQIGRRQAGFEAAALLAG